MVPTFAVHAVRDIMTKGWAVSFHYAMISTLVWIGIFIVAASVAVRIRSPKRENKLEMREV